MKWASFHPLVEAESMDMKIDTWLYGNLAHYAGQADQASFANIQVTLVEGSTVRDLLATLNMPTEERGITFINGDLSAMPNVQPDLDHKLTNGDRVAFFHLRSMWPYQYRSGATMISELSTALNANSDQGLHHTSKREEI
jgi:sulfur carrier protein ThiS